MLWSVPRLQPNTGTLVVIASGRSSSSLAAVDLSVRLGGSWSAVGSVGGDVPAAPDQRQLLEVAVPAGVYDGVRLGDQVEPVRIEVKGGQVEPVLLGIESGRLIPGAVYAGNDDVNLGLGELAGRFVAMPAFDLTDQAGRPFNLDAIAGKDVVIAAFHTTCHETCPLYTALLLQLSRHKQGSLMLVEVTTDPGTDTPGVLAAYSKQVGADWTFATGTDAQVAAFWKPFGVAIATGDSHTSTLALLDRHGYIRLVYRGAPKIGNDIPPSLVTTLSAQGLKQLAAGGDGWGAPDVLQALSTIGRSEPSPLAGGGKAPGFELRTTDGATVHLADLAGMPVVINFWGTYCPPCRADGCPAPAGQRGRVRRRGPLVPRRDRRPSPGAARFRPGRGPRLRRGGAADDRVREGRRHHRPQAGRPARRASPGRGVVQPKQSVDWPFGCSRLHFFAVLHF